MGCFYFHIQIGDEVYPEEDGIELPSLEEARREALQSARELLADAIKAGKATIPEAIVIADETGRVLEFVPLAAVLPEQLKR
jgi:hypothetical protein